MANKFSKNFDPEKIFLKSQSSSKNRKLYKICEKGKQKYGI